MICQTEMILFVRAAGPLNTGASAECCAFIIVQVVGLTQCSVLEFQKKKLDTRATLTIIMLLLGVDATSQMKHSPIPNCQRR